MAQYHLLDDIYVNNQLIEKGQIVSDTGPGALLPANYVPTAAFDPIDADAIAKFWAAGPIIEYAAPTLIRSRWTNVGVAAPLVRWVPFANPNTQGLYILTGAGRAFGPKQGMWNV
jgi:hypothetical protein